MERELSLVSPIAPWVDGALMKVAKALGVLAVSIQKPLGKTRKGTESLRALAENGLSGKPKKVLKCSSLKMLVGDLHKWYNAS